MEKETKPFWWPDTQSIIAVSLVGSLLVIAFLLILKDHKLSEVVIGGLMTVGFATIIAYYFGSSKGSKEKDDTITQMALTPTPPAAPPVPPAERPTP